MGKRGIFKKAASAFMALVMVAGFVPATAAAQERPQVSLDLTAGDEGLVSLNGASVVLGRNTYDYTGKALTPAPVVKIGGKTLKAGRDYAVSYKNNVAAGTATVTVKGKGNYAGSKSATFKIVRKAVTWKRLAGAGRYDTMAAIVSEGFPKSGWAVVATGANFPDALAASALAGAKGCPVILTEPGRLSPQAAAQLKRLGVRNAYVMGGEAAVSRAAENSIRALGVRVTRVAGASRQETSVKAMRAVRGQSKTVIVATGNGFADTLSIAPWSYATRSPIVLTSADGTLPASTVSAIRAAGYTRYVVVGGTGAVRASIETQLKGLSKVARLGGADRYETSRLVAEWELRNGLSAARPAVATGADFPDALAGAALCGKNRSVMVLAADPNAPGIASLSANRAAAVSGYILGGARAVTPAVASAAQKWTNADMPSSYTAGATSMPVSSTSAWGLTLAKLRVTSGAGVVAVSGNKVVAKKAGKATVAAVDTRTGKTIGSRTVTVYGIAGQAYSLRSALKGSLVLDISGAGKGNGANAQIWKENSTCAQIFTFALNGDGTYTLKNMNSGKALDVAGGSKALGANVRQWNPNGSAAQKWRISVDAQNRLTFSNLGSGKALDVSEGRAANGANVQQWSPNGAAAQKWTLQRWKRVLAKAAWTEKKPIQSTMAHITWGQKKLMWSYVNGVYKRWYEPWPGPMPKPNIANKMSYEKILEVADWYVRDTQRRYENAYERDGFFYIENGMIYRRKSTREEFDRTSNYDESVINAKQFKKDLQNMYYGRTYNKNNRHASAAFKAEPSYKNSIVSFEQYMDHVFTSYEHRDCKEHTDDWPRVLDVYLPKKDSKYKTVHHKATYKWVKA